jgi:hypothetical protein
VGDTALVGRRRLLLATLLIACLAGCGDDGSSGPTTNPPPPSLTAQERAQAGRSVTAIRRYCRRVARHLAGRGGVPPIDPAVAAARSIAGIARRKPEASYSGSQRARDLAADLAEDLEGTNCSQTLVEALARGL